MCRITLSFACLVLLSIVNMNAGAFSRAESASIGIEWLPVTAAGLLQPLATGASKAVGTSLAVQASATTTAGNDVFVGFSADDETVTWSLGDNLGSRFTPVLATSNPGHVHVELWHAISSGGALSQIVLTSNAPVRARALVAAEFAPLKSMVQTQAFTASASWITWFSGPTTTGSLLVGVVGVEDTAATPLLADTTSVGSAGTTGQSDTSNIEVAMPYAIGTGAPLAPAVLNPPPVSPRQR